MSVNRFRDEIVAVRIPGKRAPRPWWSATSILGRTRLPSRFGTLKQLARNESGNGNAGSASGINDGASATLVMSAEAVKAGGLSPMARVVTTAVAGVSPEVMGLGPVPATRKALQRAGLKIDDIDLIELNEAFAAQALACIRELDVDQARVNVNGGAIALGHPLGASGSRIVATLVHEMRRRGARYGLATMCIGVGQGIATILESTA